MIWSPKIGQKVKVHYRRSAQQYMKYHGFYGRVLVVGSGAGPKNALVIVEFANNKRKTFEVVVPRGNLVAI